MAFDCFSFLFVVVFLFGENKYLYWMLIIRFDAIENHLKVILSNNAIYSTKKLEREKEKRKKKLVKNEEKISFFPQ